MEEYKKVLSRFFDDLEKVDSKIDIDKVSNRDLDILNIIRSCRNKLMDCHNALGDENWVMPTMELK